MIWDGIFKKLSLLFVTNYKLVPCLDCQQAALFASGSARRRLWPFNQLPVDG